MILTVTLNTALDRTIAVPRIRLGHRHRAVESHTVAGGKGVNVARALKLLGKPVIATGLAAGPTGARIRELLAAEEVVCDFVEVPGDSRTNIALVDPTTGGQTEINERGPEVTAADLERFAERLRYLARGADLCVLAGSTPPGSPGELYAELIEVLRGEGVQALLDTDGEGMRAGLRAQPALIAPNLAEAEEAVGHEFSEPDDLATGLSRLLDMGAGEAIITREAGCIAILGEGARRRRYEAVIEPLRAVAGVGSGDALVAGFIAARHSGHGPEQCLAYGVACGAESTQHIGAGAVDPVAVERLLDRVEVRESDIAAAVG